MPVATLSCVFAAIDGPQLVFVNGHYSGPFAGRQIACRRGSAFDVSRRLSGTACARDAFGALNAATVTDGPFIGGGQCAFESPVRVYYLSTGRNRATANVRGYIRAGANWLR